MKRRKRYQIVILREDGKQYHNSVLSWFQMRRHMTFFSGIAGGMLLGTVGFFVLASWHSNLVASNLSLLRRERQLRTSVDTLDKRLEQTRSQLSQSERDLSKIEALARQENLKIPQPVAGLGGSAPRGIGAEPIRLPSSDPQISRVAEAIQELSGQANLVSKHTEGVSRIILPHLERLARTPSIWPSKGFFASRYGERQDPIDGMPAYHEGIDISAPTGSPVVAPADGLVVFTGWRTGYGNTIEISHGNGVLTRYAHLFQVGVKPGASVRRWQRIGSVGSTGRSTGPHLHYEVRVHDQAVNPQRYLLY